MPDKLFFIKRRSIYYGWLILGIAFVTLTLGFANRTTFSVFYPTIVEEFGWDRGSTAIMFSITVLVYGLAAPLAGRLVDRFNPRLVLPMGACVMGSGIILCSIATSQWQFYLFYGVMAASGFSIIGWTPFSTIISNWFVKKRGLVFGILSAGFGISLVSASIIQFLISNFGWRATYIFIGTFSITAIVPLCDLFVRRAPNGKGLFPDGIRQAQSKREPVDEVSLSTGLEVKRFKTAITPSRVMKTRQFWFLLLTSVCLFSFAEAILITHQVYILRDAGYEPMLAATIYSVFGIMTVTGNLCGFSSDHVGRNQVFIPACLLAAGAVSLLFLVRDTSHPWMPFAFAVCFGFSLGIASTVFWAIVADLFHGPYLGSIIGFIVSGFSLGSTIGPWLAGFLHDQTGNYFTTLLIVLDSEIKPAVLVWLVALTQAKATYQRNLTGVEHCD